MTVHADPLGGSTLELAPLPEGMTGFGVAELGYLLSLHPGEVTERTRQFVGLDARMTSDETILLCGASALTARGLLSAEDGQVQSRSAAALLEVAVGRTLRWTRIGILTAASGMTDVVFLLQTPELCGLVEPAATVTWWAAFGDADDDPGDLLAPLVRSRLVQPGDAVVVDVVEADGSRRNLLVGVEASGQLSCTTDVGPGGEGGTRTVVGPGQLPETLRAVVPAVSAATPGRSAPDGGAR